MGKQKANEICPETEINFLLYSHFEALSQPFPCVCALSVSGTASIGRLAAQKTLFCILDYQRHVLFVGANSFPVKSTGGADPAGELLVHF